MAQASWRRALVMVVGVSLMVLAGCSTGRNTKVEDSWIARVPEERMGSVRQAEAYRRQAADEVMRSDVLIGDSERAVDIARRSEDAAKLRRDAAKAQLEASRATGQAASIQQAEAQLRAAELELSAAQAQVNWRRENLEAWKAQKEFREKDLQVADAELSYARYRALKENGDVRVQQLAEGDFLSVLSNAKTEALNARRDADAKTQKARQARARWEQLRGYGGGGWERR